MSLKIGLVCALCLGAGMFAQQPSREPRRLKPLTFPVKPKPRDANAAAVSCPAPTLPAAIPAGESAGARSAPLAAIVPSGKGVLTVPNPHSRGAGSAGPVSLATAIVTGIAPADCNAAPVKLQFSTADTGNIYAFVSIQGGAAGDVLQWEWYDPEGNRDSAADLKVAYKGASCSWGWIPVSDVAKHPGAWTVKISYQTSVLATLNFSIGQPSSGGCSSQAGRICRDEISTFYQGAHSLGTAWVRAVFEDVFPSTLAVHQIQDSLDNLVAGLKGTPCVNYDLSAITSLRNDIPHLDSDTIVSYVGALIPSIQDAIHNAHIPCDNAASLEALFVVGVDLGASIAEAIGFVYSDPLDDDAIGFITDNMTDATSAMALYVPCGNNFTPGLLKPSNFDLTNDLVLVPLTELIGTYNLIVWNVSLSCCCCSCR